MLWYLPWSESIKKRACRYLLQRYLGNFLEEKLTLDQLSVDLYNGTGTVSDVSLDCEALNDLGDSQNWPLEIVDGYMSKITVTIPWSTLLKDDSVVKVDGLSLTVQPKVRAEPASSMLESMWSSMSSSMQLAEECLREEEGGPAETSPVEGIEMFAHAIDSILSKVKVKFVNTKIRIEHVPKNGDRGIALEIHIENIDYFDEAGIEPTPDVIEPENNKTYVVATYTSKKIQFYGVTLYTDEFPSKLRTMARSLVMEKSVSSQPEKAETHQSEMSEINFQSAISDVFYETKSVLSTIDPDPIKDIIEDAKPPTEFIREASPEERANQPDPILFAKITGQQELTLKIKRSEEVDGPKVEVKMLLGSFIFFLSPRQLHTLIELVEALNQPQLEDTSNIPLRGSGVNVQCKPMKQADFQLIEAQLLGNLEQRAAKPNPGMYGWSGPSLEESDIESEKFLPMTSQGDQLMATSFSSSASSMSASITSSVGSSAPRIKRNKKVPQIDGDPTAEVSHISFRIASLSCVLLHKDILTTTPMGIEYVSPASVNKLQQVTGEFFNNLLPFCLNEGGRKEFHAANEAIDNAIRRSHLRLITSEMTLDGSEKVTSRGSQTICEASIRHLLVRECLYSQHNEGPDSHDLIRFQPPEEDNNKKSSSSRPNVKLHFKQTSKYMRIGGEKKLVYPTTDISIKCMPVYVDVELTLVDRMTATFFGGSKAPAGSTPAPPPPQNQLNLTAQCSKITAALRFPIADLRPNVNREARRVRSDYLVFEFQNATVSCQQMPSNRPLPTVVTMKATCVDLYYHESVDLPATHIARSSMADTIDVDILKRNATQPLPTISLTFKPTKPKGPFDPLTDEASFEPAAPHPMTTSMYMMTNLQSDAPSPFSGKKTAHQSFTQHDSNSQGQEEELIVPGTEEEMIEFTTNSIECSAIHLDLDLPVLSLQLESKQLYEILYNRLNSDLLLWEPLIVDPFEINPLMCDTIYPAFGLCKGGGYDSDSDSTSSEEENLYYSTYDNKKKNLNAPKPLPETKGEHNFCLTLKVGKGLLTIYAPVRDSNKRVVPGQMGELVLDAHELALCTASGLCGRAHTALLCLRAAATALYHDSLITIPSEKPSLRLYGSSLPMNLKRTIYTSGKGVHIKDRLEAKDMFTLALRVEPVCETPNLKTICIALGIEQATLRHRGDKGIAWLTQLMDVIDVLDYPVPGYSPSAVLSELHVHVWDCAVDYRPLYLPCRTVVTLGNFTVSSNLIAATNTSCLRFLAQECTLFLHHIANAKPHTAVPQDDDKAPDVKKDYICVVDVGLFELSLRMEDKGTCSNEQPHVDLSASNNMVHLYTCWDSASALCRLLTYVASDGDAQAPAPRDPSSRHTSICSDQPLEPLVGLEDRPVEEIRELSPSEIQQVNDLMAEALKESPNSTVDEDELHSSTEKEGVEIFFFPDESNMKKKLSEETLEAEAEEPESDKPLEFEEFHLGVPYDEEEAKPANAQVVKDLGDPTASPKNSPKKSNRKKARSSSDGGNTDDEYCIVDSTPLNCDSDLEEPVVTWIGGGPPIMIDNHFTTPAARSDVLKAPKSFPLPVLRYTLCEMSVTWHMYGGTDFRAASEAAPKKTVTIEGDGRGQGSPVAAKRSQDYEPYDTSRAITAAYRQGVSWSAGSERVIPHSRTQAGKDLRTKGGHHRDHHTCVKLCLTKLKFQHETYPSGGIHASRQTLAVGKIEVLDRLLCSDINKLLSQYKLKDEPDRKNAHMLIVKAVHLRPLASVCAQECCLKVSLLPLRFNLDQDTLAFLVSFFSKLGTDESGDEDTKSVGGLSTESSSSRQTTPTHRPPVMSVGRDLRDPPPTPTSLGDNSLTLDQGIPLIRDDEPLMETYEAERLVSENLIQLEEDFNRLGLSPEKPTAKMPDLEPVDDSPIYFRRVIFSPEVPIRLDYVGKRVDLSAGPVAGLLMGLGQLNCSELTLKRLDYRQGLLGLEKLVQWALHEWLSDIKRHQLPGLLSGIGPMHSLLQLITGIRDLVWLPVEQWRRDGRLVHGLRRGAASFTARTAVAALDITTRLLQLIQEESKRRRDPPLVPAFCLSYWNSGAVSLTARLGAAALDVTALGVTTRLLHLMQATAETAFEMLTPAPTLQLQHASRRARRRRRRDPAQHPADLRAGVASACRTVREGFAETAATMAMAARNDSGVGVLRHLPGAAVAPLALAAAGAADVLGGVRAHLAPHHRRDSADKWRHH